MRAAKNEELVLREKNDGTQWQKNFAEIEQATFQTNTEEEIAQHIVKHFEDMTGDSAENCLVSRNFARGAQTAQRFWFEKCGEDGGSIVNLLGEIPKVITQPVVKAKTGDLTFRAGT